MSLPPFAAPLWLKSGHLQTTYVGLLWQPAPLRPDEVLKLQVADGVQLRCELNLADRAPGQRLWVLVHGLEGSSEAAYVISTARKGLLHGWDVLRLNIRGCGDSCHLSQTAYHAGMSADILAVCQAMSERGYSEIVVAGFSLGGHQALKLATELTAPPSWLKGVCAISPPVDLAATSRNLLRLENRGYERYFFKQMCQTYRQRRRLWPELTPVAPWEKLRTLYDFDEYITAPSFDYQGADDYYTQNSVLPHLPKITLPTQVIIAADDPIIPFASHQQAMALAPDHVQWLVTSEGGHVGFINSPGLARQDRDVLWAENRLLDFAEACL